MANERSHTHAYLWTAAALLVLLGVTVMLAKVPLGALAPVVAMTIAGVKAALVAAFFMHLKFDRPVTRLFAGAGVLWFLILLSLTLADVMTRQ